ncbi:transmembrane protein, putative (macronuclear) [Tetrahymena thermophila SB210]|uniref:Transmembrane protein, putative n=1 Tax=Tetrahymena thermophila (strain SB210) TaxID=312017 RepID=Q22X59_TETTS|nr:transmembrane protein, putative [Tetrahymena thermophila SB210]EAR89787.1 transmembrane protein, putative [Tetrahymena thermophila SB210]|eukprot:XP_001010032.1 transmembrane protein, putative [Tetrahymena thermophila SB210]
MYFINSYLPYPSLIANMFIFYLISSANYDVFTKYLKTGKIDCKQQSSMLLSYLVCSWACFTIVLNCPPLYIYNHIYQFITFALWFLVYNFQQNKLSAVIFNIFGFAALIFVLLQFHHFYVGVFSSILNVIYVLRSYLQFKRTIEDQKTRPPPTFNRLLGIFHIVGFFFNAIQNIEGDILHFPFLQACVQFGAIIAQEMLVSQYNLYSDSKQKVDQEKKKKEQ